MVDAISPAEVRELLRSEQHVAVIDIREPLDYSGGHIEESTLVPRRVLESRLPEVVPNPSAHIILCDQQCERALVDAEWLENLGYQTVSYLDGGMDAWEEAGFESVEVQEGVYGTSFNYPSKDFGERVQVERGIEQIQPDELKALLEDESNEVLVTDVRTPEEYHSNTIPGALNVEGVDLGLYIEQLRQPNQTLVVNCAGRTRSIIGAATLEKLGVENVYELENGTMGWELAGHQLEHHAERYIRSADLDEDGRTELRSKVEALLEENGIPKLSIAEFQELQNDERSVVFPIDVRTREEYHAGHIPGAVGVPGGQAIQTADEHIAVRNGTIVFISNDHIRSAITAYWFSEMGYPSVTVLEGGLGGWKDAEKTVQTRSRTTQPQYQSAIAEVVTYISPSELSQLTESQTPVVIDVDTSDRFTEGHVPGARWIPRYHLDQWLEENDTESDETIVFVCRDGDISTYTAAAIQYEYDFDDARVLKGGTNAWETEGYPLEEGSDRTEFEPRDVVPKPYHQGEWAKRAYLDWEEKLGEKYE